MMKSLFTLLLPLVLLLSAAPARAQEVPPEPPQPAGEEAPEQQQAAEQLTPEHLQAAEEMLDHLNMAQIMEETIDATLKTQLQQNPGLAAFEDIMRAFMMKYMGWENLRVPVVQLYAEAFTLKELEDMTAFYQTETGQKAAALTPILMQRGMALGEEIVQAHLPELEQQVQERVKELEGAN